jgi:hypothetical protein
MSTENGASDSQSAREGGSPRVANVEGDQGDGGWVYLTRKRQHNEAHVPLPHAPQIDKVASQMPPDRQANAGPTASIYGWQPGTTQRDPAMPRPSSPKVADEDCESAISDSSSATPDVLRDYFGRAGEVYVARERLNELEADLEDDILDTDNEIEARGRCSGTPDTTSQRIREKHQHLSDALALAQHTLFMQKLCCLRQGVDPEKFRYRRISPQRRRRTRKAHVQAMVVEWLELEDED